MTISNFLSFDKMITPTLITVLFYIFLGASALTGISLIITGFSSSFGGGFMVFYGFMVLLIGPIFARVYCELLIVLFKIHSRLRNIDDSLAHGSRKEEGLV